MSQRWLLVRQHWANNVDTVRRWANVACLQDLICDKIGKKERKGILELKKKKEKEF